MDEIAVISHEDGKSMQAVSTDFLPLAITLENETFGCVAGVDPAKTWLRLSPIPAAWARDQAGPLRYRVWSRLMAKPPPASQRPEDRCTDGMPVPDRIVEEAEYENLLATIADAQVGDAFSQGRTVGVIRAQIRDVYARRHTRGRLFLRMAFSDETGEIFDWVWPETSALRTFGPHICNWALEEDFAKGWLKETASAQVFLAIGLTLPKHDQTGRFGGCQPLVVGAHRVGFTASAVNDVGAQR